MLGQTHGQTQGQSQGQQAGEIYGYPLLDNLHELFPEILYDTNLFPHDGNDSFARVLGWLRFRMTHLYPQTFNYARQQYLIHTAPERRFSHDDWNWLRTPPIVMSPLQAALNTGHWGTNTIYNNNNNIHAAAAAVSMDDDPPRSRVLTTNAMNQILVNTRFDDLLGLTALLIPRTNPFAGFYDPVVVRPTEQEIINGSTHIDSLAVASDTICAICQDRESPRDVSGSVAANAGWRMLNICRHIFHRDCIDRWFEGHVMCPVCRADIRSTQHISSNQSVAESVAESVLSDQD